MRVREVKAKDLNSDDYTVNPHEALKDDAAFATRKTEDRSPLSDFRHVPEEPYAPIEPEVDVVRHTPSALTGNVHTPKAPLPAARTTHKDANSTVWIRQDPLSLAVPYEVKEIFVRTLTIPILSKLHLAAKQRSFTLLVDALAPCFSGIDPRDLTPGDYNFYMHWIRDNSYTKRPITIGWLSRYNNQNTLDIRGTQLEFVELEMTQETYDSYRAKGLCAPTVRDMEILKDPNLAEEDEWRLDYAQYCYYKPENGDYSDYVDGKLTAFDRLVEDNGLEDAITMIDEYSAQLSHGVNESFVIRDPMFKPEAAADYFEALANNTFSSIKALTEEQQQRLGLQLIPLIQSANEYLAESVEIREALKRGETPLATEEVVALTIQATDFFPNLR